MIALDSDQTRLVARAFDRAWANVLRESKGQLYDVQSARDMLAKRIVILAEAGERDEWRLARAASISFRTQQVEGGGTKSKRRFSRLERGRKSYRFPDRDRSPD